MLKILEPEADPPLAENDQDQIKELDSFVILNI
jgi:hypothetical protein